MDLRFSNMKQPQLQQILEILMDCEPHRFDEFQQKIFGGIKYGAFRLGARIYDLRKKGYSINGWKDKTNPALYWYQMQTAKTYRDRIIDPNSMPQFIKTAETLKPEDTGTQYAVCCYSMFKFKTHDPNCETTKEKAGRLL